MIYEKKNILVCLDIELLLEANGSYGVNLLRRRSTGHNLGRNGQKFDLRCYDLSHPRCRKANMPRRVTRQHDCSAAPATAALPPFPQ